MQNQNDVAGGFFARHTELYKFIKFSVMGGLATIIELVVYYLLQGYAFRSINTSPVQIWIFSYEGRGYMWAFLISTTIGYAIAFVLNRKLTFQADANPAISILLYIIMVLFTIAATTWLGTAIMSWSVANGYQRAGEIIAKPIVASLAVLWTYPLNRFVIHRKKRTQHIMPAESDASLA